MCNCSRGPNLNLTIATTSPEAPEIFASVQGEGPSAGAACVFIRLSRCNLACVWCDTAYTWRFEGDLRPHRDNRHHPRASNQVTLSGPDVVARVLALDPRRLVITGGEPLLQGPALARTIAALKSVRPALHVEVETNGTVAAHSRLDPLIDQFNVSPKLAHSGNSADLALLPERLAAYAVDPRAWFKFVIAAPEDLAEVRELAARYAIAAQRIFLMPEGVTSATLRARLLWLEPLAASHGLNVTDRLHIHLYGDRRGT